MTWTQEFLRWREAGDSGEGRAPPTPGSEATCIFTPRGPWGPGAPPDLDPGAQAAVLPFAGGRKLVL